MTPRTDDIVKIAEDYSAPDAVRWLAERELDARGLVAVDVIPEQMLDAPLARCVTDQ